MTFPLNQRTIPVKNKENGLLKEAPAIHKMWSVQGRAWPPYQPPNQLKELSGVQGARDTWIAGAKKVESSLSWLLRLPCHKFWSQVCNDDDLHCWLESLLETFPRDHDIDLCGDEMINKTNGSILQKLFLFFVRLCTYKESQTDFFTPEYYGHMIYDKYLLEMPKILDICTLFRPCNAALTHKMVNNVFTVQPQYVDDLITAGLTMDSAMESLGEQLHVLEMSPPSHGSVPSYLDLVNYVVDISHTMSALLEVYPPAAGPLHQGAQLEAKVASFYSLLVAPLVTYTHSLQGAGLLSPEEVTTLCQRLSLARHHLIQVFRCVINQVCLTPLLQDDILNRVEPVEELLTIFTSVLSDRTFLLDYNSKYPLRDDLDILEQIGLDVDPTRKNYILDAFSVTKTQTFTGLGARPKVAAKASDKRSTSPKNVEYNKMSSNANSDKKLGGVELDSLISTVRDLLPYLGEGFVEQCLHSYQYKVDDLINALLEGNLAPHLSDLDQSKGREDKPAPEQIIPRSVYENDEFDVNTRDNLDMSRVHRGKKNKTGDAKKLLDDKSDLVDLKDRFSQLGVVSDEMFGEDLDNGYDDEYDDTYDDNAVGQREPDAGESTGRKFVLPVALGGGKIQKQGIVDIEDSEEEEDEGIPKNLNFVRNPEEIREDRERRHQQKMGRGGGGGHRGGGGGGPAPGRDVVGRAKGQGQDKQVLINRARKNANKGSGQRRGADRKAARGMF